MVADPMQTIRVGFMDEARELSQRFTLEFLNLERLEPGSAPMGQSYQELARALHTLKGTAATLGMEPLAQLAHGLEEQLAPWKESQKRPPPELGDRLLAGLDGFLSLLQSEVAHVAKDRTEVNDAGEPSDGVAVSARDTRSQWRVEASQVIALIHEVERLREVRLRIDERRRELDGLLAKLTRGSAQRDVTELHSGLLSHARAVASDSEETGDLIRVLEENVRALSTIPVHTLLDPLHRAVRDLCRMTGKEAQLSVVGAEISLDRRVMESIRGPLAHLVRNAVDHGVELPAERVARGKHREGALIIRVEQQGNMLFLEVSDDGNGVDLAEVKRVALERRLHTREELAALSPAQIAQLIFHAGFSTRSEVSAISGLGVGLDVVRSEVLAIEGQVEVQSVPGQGSRFILSLPVALGSSPMLLVRCAEHDFALPMLSLHTTIGARREALRITPQGMWLDHEDELISLVDLGALLKLRASEPPTHGQPLLLVQAQGRRVALAVDATSGDRELVVRPLPPELREVPAYQGVCMLAQGELAVILRPDWLVSPERTQEISSARANRRALVVDDSLTARALHRSMLESGGYSVHAVPGAAQALEQLRHAHYDVMVCDVAMEGMDGLALTQMVRAQALLRDLPIVLVSGEPHGGGAERARSAGADGFLNKLDCARGRLLAEVTQAVQHRSGVKS